MGMYNEVYCTCPECGQTAEMQISQIVLGFGEFHIQKRETMENLTEEELTLLHESVREEKFRCPCGNWFNPLHDDEPPDDTLGKLFGI